MIAAGKSDYLGPELPCQLNLTSCFPRFKGWLIKINHHNRQDGSQLNDYIEHFHEGWIFIFILDKVLELES